MTTLTTDRLILTPKSVEDLDPLTALWGDAAFTGQIGLPLMSPETVWFRLLRDIGHWDVFGYGNWAVRRREDGAFLGSVGVFNYRRDLEPAFDAPEVGWGLAPAFHGQGYAQEALAAALSHADTALDLTRTVCMIGPDNAPSLKLARRAGFDLWREGLYRGETLIMMERVRP
jgi:RimJ/RimL family protein N-acetyltransferase